MFVYVWWISLCECFQPSAVEALSHSHVVEWIFGSRIQSHWPCMTLCPISMFSRILATDRPAVPSTQSGGSAEPRSTAREASSRRRCTSTTLRMYAASFSPRLSSTSWRIASSSMPSCSMSSGVRWAVGFTGFLVMAVISSLLVVEVARPGGRVDAGLDAYAAGPGLTGDRDGEGAVAQVAHRALLHRHDAPHADPHPATTGHQDARALGGVEDRGGAVGVDDRAVGEGDGAAALPVLGSRDGRGSEAFGGQDELAPDVVLLERVEESGRTAGVRRALGQVRDDRVEVVDVEHPVGVGVHLHESQPAGGVVLPQLAAEDHLGPGEGRVEQHDVGLRPLGAGE